MPAPPWAWNVSWVSKPSVGKNVAPRISGMIRFDQLHLDNRWPTPSTGGPSRRLGT